MQQLKPYYTLSELEQMTGIKQCAIYSSWRRGHKPKFDLQKLGTKLVVYTSQIWNRYPELKANYIKREVMNKEPSNAELRRTNKKILPYYRLAEFAKLVGESYKALYARHKRGKLGYPVKKLGSIYVVYICDICSSNPELWESIQEVSIINNATTPNLEMLEIEEPDAE